MRALQFHPEFASLVLALVLQPKLKHADLEIAFRSLHAANAKALAALHLKPKANSRASADKVKEVKGEGVRFILR